MIVSPDVKVFLAVGVTDLRKSINGLSALVEEEMSLNPFKGALFGFCNRKRDLIKLLYWDRNGFALWMKRLEKDHFPWPNTQDSRLDITGRELRWLLDGLTLESHAFERLKFESAG